MATRQPKGDNIGFYLRIPAELKVQLEARAKQQGCSLAQLICDLARQGLGLDEAAPAASDVEISEWLQSVDG